MSISYLQHVCVKYPATSGSNLTKMLLTCTEDVFFLLRMTWLVSQLECNLIVYCTLLKLREINIFLPCLRYDQFQDLNSDAVVEGSSLQTLSHPAGCEFCDQQE